jgi:hypothetical protein
VGQEQATQQVTYIVDEIEPRMLEDLQMKEFVAKLERA